MHPSEVIVYAGVALVIVIVGLPIAAALWHWRNRR